MKFTAYLKDHLFFYLSQLMLVLFFALILHTANLSLPLTLLLTIAAALIAFSWTALDYYKRNHFYKGLFRTLDALTEKTYIATMLEEADFCEAVLLSDVLQQCSKSMNDKIALYQSKNREYQEYIEAWIHEIKVPISCISLLCDNHGEEFLAVQKENTRIENYVEQALYYARSTNVEKDYMIRSVTLSSLVSSVLKKHSRELIGIRTQIRTEHLDYTVYTDAKWLDFILGQIISNSVKYRERELTLLFRGEERDNTVILSITDNGIGIPPQELSRVTAKGFTGTNGRKFAKSTGIGLYLCEQLCSKMHMKLSVSSVEGEGTTVRISFPADKLALLKD